MNLKMKKDGMSILNAVLNDVAGGDLTAKVDLSDRYL